MSVCLTHARIVTPDEVIEDGALVIEDGRIRAIEPASLPRGRHIDCDGALLVPGVVDLHSDHVETVIESRPGVFFPVADALPEIDALNARAGITTAFHAISFADRGRALRRLDNAVGMIDALHALREEALIDHRIHARFEVTHPEGLPAVRDLLRGDRLDLLSIMDHSPGQGQFKTMEAFVAYYSAHRGMSEAEAASLGERFQQASIDAVDHVRGLLAEAREVGLPIASHDDDHPERVRRFHELGVGLCEFPINLVTARAAADCGMPTILGAPNVIRGGSQSGSMRVLDAVLAGVCDCLCSDYAPWTVLQAALKLPSLAECSLPQAMRLASLNPARAVGLDDRGAIAAEQRADLVVVDDAPARPRIRQVWSAGRLVLDHSGVAAREPSHVGAA